MPCPGRADDFGADSATGTDNGLYLRSSSCGSSERTGFRYPRIVGFRSIGDGGSIVLDIHTIEVIDKDYFFGILPVFVVSLEGSGSAVFGSERVSVFRFAS